MTARSVPALPFALACLLTAMAVPSQAGTAQTPEMPDRPSDACLDLNPGGPVPSLPCVPVSQATSLDVLAAWVDADDPSNLTFHLAVAAMPAVANAGAGADLPVAGCQQAGAEFAYLVHFRARAPDGTQLVTADEDGNEFTDLYVAALGACDAQARVGGAPWELSLAYTYFDGVSSYLVSEAVNGTVDNATFTWKVPRQHPWVGLPVGDAAAGHQVTNLSATSGLGIQGVAVSGVFAADLAPDEGFGENFTFPSPPLPAAPPAAIEAPATGPASTTTVTRVQVRTEVMTVTVTESFTSTPFPLHVEAKGAPAAGLMFVALALGTALLVRRRLA